MMRPSSVINTENRADSSNRPLPHSPLTAGREPTMAPRPPASPDDSGPETSGSCASGSSESGAWESAAWGAGTAATRTDVQPLPTIFGSAVAARSTLPAPPGPAVSGPAVSGPAVSGPAVSGPAASPGLDSVTVAP